MEKPSGGLCRPAFFLGVDLGAVVVIYSLPKSYVIYRKPRRLSDERREQARQMVKQNELRK